LIGVALHQPLWSSKLLLIALFILMTNPIGSSTLARAFMYKNKMHKKKYKDINS